MPFHRSKFRPMYPAEREVARLHQEMRKMIHAMRADYLHYLKPLVLRMSRQAREELAEENKVARELAPVLGLDSEQLLTPEEAASRLGISEQSVYRAVKRGDFEGVVYNNGRPRIPETSVQAYEAQLEKDEPLVDRFMKRLELLERKYASLQESLEKQVRRTMTKLFKDSGKKFGRQFYAQGGIDILKVANGENLHLDLEKRIVDCVALIRSIPQEYFEQVEDAVFSNMAGTKKFEGGLQQRIVELGHISYERASVIARDQTMKAASSFAELRMRNCGIQYYIWRNSKDRRVAGNPAGLYPRNAREHLDYTRNKEDGKLYYEGHPGTDLSRTHGNHWAREGKVFSWETPPPDGPPGMAICCRCYAEPYFPPGALEELAGM